MILLPMMMSGARPTSSQQLGRMRTWTAIAVVLWVTGCIDGWGRIDSNLRPVTIVSPSDSGADGGNDAGLSDGGGTDGGTPDASAPDSGCRLEINVLPGIPKSMNSAGIIGLQLNRNGTGIAGIRYPDAGVFEIAGVLSDGGLRETMLTEVLENGCVIGDTSHFIDYALGGSPEPFLWCPTTGLQQIHLPDGGGRAQARAAQNTTIVGELRLQPSRWTDRNHTFAPTPAGFVSGSILGIQSSLKSVGYSSDNNRFVPTIWNAVGAPSRLQSVASYTIATDISDTGLVVGFGAATSCTWENELAFPVELYIPVGHSYVEAKKVRGATVFGYSHTTRRHAAVWRRGVDQAPEIFSDWTTDAGIIELREVTDISESAQTLLAIGFDVAGSTYVGLLIERVNCD